MGEAPDDRADRRVGQGGEAGWCGNTGPDESRGGNPRPVFLRPPSVTGAGHGSRIGLRALILSHATFRCVGADDLV